jgi:hypothetical protein
LVEVVVVMGVSAMLFLSVGGLLRESVEVHRERAQQFALRTGARATLRLMARELEQAKSSSVSVDGGRLAFNLVGTLSASGVGDGPPIAYRLEGETLVRDRPDQGAPTGILASCTGFSVERTALPFGTLYTLTLARAGHAAGYGEPIPWFVERVTVTKMNDG